MIKSIMALRRKMSSNGNTFLFRLVTLLLVYPIVVSMVVFTLLVAAPWEFIRKSYREVRYVFIDVWDDVFSGFITALFKGLWVQLKTGRLSERE